MTLLDIINMHEIVNDETRMLLNRLPHDPEHGTTGHCYGHWYDDHILKYMNCKVQNFSYYTYYNWLVITIFEEA